jgi:hypothetical protein
MRHASHGDRSRYTAGCRCARCTEAQRNYQREFARKKRAHGLAPGDERHGTMSGYDNHGCRCSICRAAAITTRQQRRAEAQAVAARVRAQALSYLEQA